MPSMYDRDPLCLRRTVKDYRFKHRLLIAWRVAAISYLALMLLFCMGFSWSFTTGWAVAKFDALRRRPVFYHCPQATFEGWQYAPRPIHMEKVGVQVRPCSLEDNAWHFDYMRGYNWGSP
jgi:hypothetical protein